MTEDDNLSETDPRKALLESARFRRGLINGCMLGTILWLIIIIAGVLVWRWLH